TSSVRGFFSPTTAMTSVSVTAAAFGALSTAPVNANSFSRAFLWFHHDQPSTATTTIMTPISPRTINFSTGFRGLDAGFAASGAGLADMAEDPFRMRKTMRSGMGLDYTGKNGEIYKVRRDGMIFRQTS